MIYLQLKMCIFSVDVAQCVLRNSGGEGGKGCNFPSKGPHHRGAPLGKNNK